MLRSRDHWPGCVHWSVTDGDAALFNRTRINAVGAAPALIPYILLNVLKMLKSVLGTICTTILCWVANTWTKRGVAGGEEI